MRVAHAAPALTLATRWLVMMAALSACASSLPPSAALPADPDRAALDAAMSAWREAGLPWSPVCDEELARVHVVVSYPKEFTELCGRAPVNGGGKLYACSTEQHERMFPWWVVDNDRVPLLVISALQPEPHRRLLVVHEAMHWMERCSGKGIDFDHADERVWQGARITAQRDVGEWRVAGYRSARKRPRWH